jgi:hypothetical protein
MIKNTILIGFLLNVSSKTIYAIEPASCTTTTSCITAASCIRNICCIIGWYGTCRTAEIGRVEIQKRDIIISNLKKENRELKKTTIDKMNKSHDIECQQMNR